MSSRLPLFLAGAALTLSCVAANPGDGVPGDGASGSDATHAPLVPGWVDDAPSRVGGEWTLVGVGHADDGEQAVVLAHENALAQLKKLQGTQLESTLALAQERLASADAALGALISYDALRAEARRQLESTQLVGEPYVIEDAPGSVGAWLRLSLAETDLHPDESLRRLLTLDGMSGLDVRFLEETERAEQLGRIEWAHLAAALAERERSDSPDLLIRLARFHVRSGHPLTAKRLLDRARPAVASLEPDDASRQLVDRFALELFDGVPTLYESSAVLAVLSANTERPEVLERGRGRSRRAVPTTWYLNLNLKVPGRRLLALWIEEDELRRLELPRGGDVGGIGPYHLGLALDADFTGASLMIWALPSTHGVWRAADALSGQVLELTHEDGGGEGPRLRLDTLVSRLERLAEEPDVGSLVVEI